MDFKSLLGLSVVCAMGAISPGPSLAVVLRNTISGGRRQGVMTGIGHGLGFFIYAFVAVMSLSSLILGNQNIYKILQLIGSLILIWISYGMITSSSSPNLSEKKEMSSRKGFAEGFMIAFLNPKILVFLVAVFSQFIDPDMSNSSRLFMAFVAGVIDTTWYVLVALLFAETTILKKLRLNAAIVDRTVDIFLLLFAIFLFLKLFGFDLLL